ncbi:MAG TPA: hypothetical protein VFA03_14220 [Acetobacteraceae bacterium]|nr:hypothetical protein [Acetobacteraceae bacterium]
MPVRLRFGLALLAAFALGAPAAHARTLEAVRASGTVRCGAEPRSGFADEKGGMALDLCRAFALAALGPAGKVAFHLYAAPRDFAPVRAGQDDVAFLTADAIAEQRLAPRIVPGPVAFIDPVTLLFPAGASAHSLRDLQAKVICVLIGDPGQRALQQAMEAAGIGFAPLPFQEAGEMQDGFRAGRCAAEAGRATDLAAARRPGDMLLDPPLALEPVFAATPNEDARWTALVAWVLDALILKDTPASGWHAQGAAALPVTSAIPGLRPDWRAALASALGSYGAILQHNVVGPLGLTSWPNAPWPAGLLLPPAVR